MSARAAGRWSSSAPTRPAGRRAPGRAPRPGPRPPPSGHAGRHGQVQGRRAGGGPGRPPRLVRGDPDGAVAMAADERGQRAGRGPGGRRVGARAGSSRRVWHGFEMDRGPGAIPAPRRSMVRLPRRATPQGRRDRCAHRRVRHGRRPRIGGFAGPQPALRPPPADLFASVEIAAVRGPVMTPPPLDPGARSDGNLDESSTLFEPALNDEPPQARPAAAQPKAQGRDDQEEHLAARLATCPGTARASTASGRPAVRP